jgi:hypothetical protein
MPTAFHSGVANHQLDVAAVLNLIGVLTTPPLSGGASLSELWAFVRYLFALTDDDDMRLTSDFQEMDPHQKTILSDDFGMGFSMHWLAERLDLIAACDGRYFIENHLTYVGGNYTGGTAKRGLGKSPDFIALDRHGRFHVIECKGTQSSLAYRNSQLRDTARIQKLTVQFPAHLAGERLAAGIYIAGPSGDQTELRIIDPEPREKYVIEDEDPTLVRNAVARGALTKVLRTSGFPRMASAVAYPRVRPNIEVPGEFREREEDVVLRREQATREITERGKRAFVVEGEEYVGRKVRLELPRPILTGRGVYSAVEIRQGLNRASFEEVKARALDARVFVNEQAKHIMAKYKFGESRGRAWITLGNGFYSDMRFLR